MSDERVHYDVGSADEANEVFTKMLANLLTGGEIPQSITMTIGQRPFASDLAACAETNS